MNPCILVFGMPRSGTSWIGKRPFGFDGLNGRSQSEEFTCAGTPTADTDYYSLFKRAQALVEHWRAELAPDIIDRILRILHTGGTSILLVIPESRSDIRDPLPLCINALRERHWIPAFAGMTTRKVDQTFSSSPLSRFYPDVGQTPAALPEAAV